MAKSPKRKPSFEPSGAEGRGRGAEWVYRTDAAAPDTAAPATTAPDTAVPDTAALDATPAAPVPASGRSAGAEQLVARYARYSAAAGLVPVPVVDVAAIAGVQVAMLGALAAHYAVPYSRERGKALVAALLGGLMPSLAGHQVLKVVGPLLGMISVSGFAMAATYAVGRLFIAHFESGGTLLDVDVEQSRRQLAAGISRR